MNSSLFQAVTLGLSTISVQFGALVSAFILYASGEIAAAYRQRKEEEELVNPVIVARFDMLQKSAAISTFFLLASPVFSIVALLVANQLDRSSQSALFGCLSWTFVVMLVEIALFAFAIWLIITSMTIYLSREMSVHRLILRPYVRSKRT